VPDSTVTKEEQYQAAHEGAIVVDRGRLGVLKFTGDTRLDLIHRMSTQDVVNLPPGTGAATVLTTDIGRIIDRLLLYATSDTVYALTGEDNVRNVGQYLLRFVFYGDDFHIDDLSDETAVLGIYGPEAAARLADAGVDTAELPLHHWREIELKGVQAYLHRTDPMNGGGYFVMGDAADQDGLVAALTEAGVVLVDEALFDYVRIEAGLPRFGQELTDDYIPLEANLWDDVSFTKGCYIGQEIIARMESRGRMAKVLKRLRPRGPVEVGATLTAGGKKAGAITSAAEGPAGWVALGYVRTSALEKDPDELQAGDVSVKLLD
jgi:aminomethyltransferase